MTLEEALASFTIDAAYAGHQEAHLGTWSPAKGRFHLLDRDIFTQPPTQMWQTLVLRLGGWSKSQYKTNENQQSEAVMPVKNLLQSHFSVLCSLAADRMTATRQKT